MQGPKIMLTPSMLADIVAVVDQDNDGQVNLQEFSRFAAKTKEVDPPSQSGPNRRPPSPPPHPDQVVDTASTISTALQQQRVADRKPDDGCGVSETKSCTGTAKGIPRQIHAIFGLRDSRFPLRAFELAVLRTWREHNPCWYACCFAAVVFLRRPS